MKYSRIILFSLFAVYSLLLIVVELQTSQDHVRNYFTDIEGPVPFYAVNTTISVFLLWATALMFAASFACTDKVADTRRLRWFLCSQILVFSFLAVCPGFYFRPHYFVFLLPAAALLAGIAAGSIAALLKRPGFGPLVAVRPTACAIASRRGRERCQASGAQSAG